MANHNQIEPFICLNKADLATSKERDVLAEYQRLGMTTAIATSTVTLEGVDELKELLKGRVGVFVGQSGVGKSSLINALDPRAEFKTGEISRA